MSKLFRNSSPDALTLKQSIEQEKRRNAETRHQKRQARELAAQGRGEDTEIAHVTRGEFVVPQALQTPEFMAALQRAAEAQNIPLERLRVGSAKNSLNPATGAPEFAHSVEDEPRVPKGYEDKSGEWTRGAASKAESPKSISSAQGQTVSITHPDGTTEVRTGGTRSWRNNNPGNLETKGGFAKQHGAIGSDGRFAIFPDEATGEAAAQALLNERYPLLTVDQVIEKRTPPEKGNDTERTKQLVRQFSGLPGDAIVGRLKPDEKQRLYEAIRRSEGWHTGTITHSASPS